MRLSFAWKGIRTTWAHERSFRTHSVFAMGAIALLILLRPSPIWWALFIITISLVLAAELFNTALEKLIDRVHPESHPEIAAAKDCAAGAVLVFSIASLGVLISFLIEHKS